MTKEFKKDFKKVNRNEFDFYINKYYENNKIRLLQDFYMDHFCWYNKNMDMVAFIECETDESKDVYYIRG